jgi:hypothetical protein
VFGPDEWARRVVVDPRSTSITFRPIERRCCLPGKGAMVSGSGVCTKRIVVDACHHMLSHLSSMIAKELLNDHKVIIVRCEEICISAGLARQ